MVNGHPRPSAQFRQQAQERARKEAFARNAGRFLTTLLLLPLVAFLLMLAVGAVHGFAPAVPAIGYGTTLLLVLGVDALSALTKLFRK
jgi:preprotein translocase subunit SecD